MVSMKTLKEQLEEKVEGVPEGEALAWRPYVVAEYLDVAPKVIVRASVRCASVIAKGRRKGETCNHLLCKVDVDRWEEVMTDAREDVCVGCGNVYTLADYR